MPLQIRRGPTADRVATIPLAGELVYDTTTGSVYVGNGAAAGGLPVTNFSVGDARSTTAKMFLGESLSDNTVHSGITFAYVGDRLQATIAQDLSNYIGLIAADQGFKGNLWADDSGLIINSETKTIYGNLVAEGDILPDADELYDLGSPTRRFKDLYLSGSSLYLGNIILQDVDGHLDLPAGTTIGGAIISLDEGNQYIISIQGNVIGSDSTLLVDSANGRFNGDLYGSVFGFDSSILVDARDGVLRGQLIGTLTGNVTGDLTGNASSASIASAVSLTATNASATTQYITFVDAATGNENLRTDTDLTYTPSTNTLTASFFVGTLTGTLNGDVTASTIYTSTIDTSDSSAISVVPAIIFNSDLTVENELITRDILPSNSEVSNIGSFAKKYSKLYLTEAANALWIGNAAIGSSGSIINLPAGSTIGGSAISAIVGGTNYNIGILANDSSVIINSATKTITGSFIGNVTGNVTGTVSSIANHTIQWNITAEDSTSVAISNGSTLKVLGDSGISTLMDGNDLRIRLNDVESFKPTLNTTDVANYIPFVGNTSASSYIGSSVNLRFNPGSGYFDVPIVNAGTVIASTSMSAPLITNSANALFFASSFNDGTVISNTVQVGTNTTDGRFAVQVGSYISGGYPWITYRQIHDTADANNLLISRARGTTTAPTIVQTGDDIIDISFAGYDGATYRTAALITVAVEGTVTGTAVPGKVTIQTAASTGTLTNAVVINSKQETSFNGPAVLKAYANTTARDTAVTAPSAGMLIYITATGKFQGYNGVTSGWDDLN